MEQGLHFLIITKGVDLVNTNPDDMEKQEDSEKEEEMDLPFELVLVLPQAHSILRMSSHNQVVVGTHHCHQDPRN